jgi:hypothetical protein
MVKWWERWSVKIPPSKIHAYSITSSARARSWAGRVHDGHGLYLQTNVNGQKSWLLRYERDGRERWMGLGPLHVVTTLKAARERARAAKLLLLDGIDPIDHRKAERAARAAEKARALTFREAAQRYFDQHEGKWRNAKHRAQFLSTLETYAYPTLGNMAVADIDTAAVLRTIEPHWLTKTETMNRTRGRIERVLDWCKVRGYRAGDNPAAWKGHLAEVLPGVELAAHVRDRRQPGRGGWRASAPRRPADRWRHRHGLGRRGAAAGHQDHVRPVDARPRHVEGGHRGADG